MAFDPKKLEEARQKAASKKSMDEVRNEPGLIDLGVGGLTKPDLQQVGAETQKEYEQMGHPTIGKLANMGISNLLEIASMGAGAESKAADVAFAPTIEAGGKALGKAEELVGVTTKPFSSADLPQSASEAIDLSKEMGEMVKHTPEEIAKVMEPAGINNLRKVIEYTLDTFKTKLPGTNLAAISKAKELLTKAVDLAEPSLAAPREALRNAYTRSNILMAVPRAVGIAAKAAKSSVLRGL